MQPYHLIYYAPSRSACVNLDLSVDRLSRSTCAEFCRSIILFTIALCLFTIHHSLKAQGVSINETGAVGNTNAILDVSSDDKGVLIPRLTTISRNVLGATLAMADKGMLVYDKDLNEMYHWDGTQWAIVGANSNTDNQNITGSGLIGTNLTIGIENGTNETIDLSSLVNDGDTLIGNEYVTNFSITNDSLVIADSGSTKKIALADINAADWHKLGNSGTNPATDFIGTTDAQDLVFKTNSLEELRILSNGNVGIGTSTPGAALEVNSGNNGILIPQINLIDTSDVTTITTPSNSLLVYNTNDTMRGGNGIGYYQWDTAATKWLYMITSPNGPGTNGDVLTSKGSGLPPAWKSAASGGGGCMNKIEIFDTPGSFTWTRPAGVDVVYVTIVGAGGGGGGGGGGASNHFEWAAGGAGGGGGQSFFNYPIAVTSDVTVVVGAGGTGGSAGTGSAASPPPYQTSGADGTDGGDSSFDTFIAKGGKGAGGGGGAGNSGTGEMSIGGEGGGGSTGLFQDHPTNSSRLSVSTSLSFAVGNNDFIGSAGGAGGRGYGFERLTSGGINAIEAHYGFPCGAYPGGKAADVKHGGGGGASSFGSGGDGGSTTTVNGNPGGSPGGFGGGGGGGAGGRSRNGNSGYNGGVGGNGAGGMVIVQWSE